MLLIVTKFGIKSEVVVCSSAPNLSLIGMYCRAAWQKDSRKTEKFDQILKFCGSCCTQLHSKFDKREWICQAELNWLTINKTRTKITAFSSLKLKLKLKLNNSLLPLTDPRDAMPQAHRVVYTNVSLVKWWPRPSPVYHTDRPPKLTGPETTRGRLWLVPTKI